jgi:MFS family permease
MEKISRGAAPSPFSINNVRRFIIFRVCFNARFYYPIFAILFLDFGLTLEQFALLNVVWAATIVLLEVPSGALADTMGRKNLLVLAGSLMVVEMLLLCVIPIGHSSFLFTVLLINRILSGTAEAAASGADEALAYDALKHEGDISEWGQVLERQMRYQSMAYIGAMTLGAAVYDPALVQRVLGLFGLDVVLSQNTTLRFPIYLTLGMAVITLITTLGMDRVNERPEDGDTQGGSASVKEAFKLTFQAGGWILKTPFALAIIAAGFAFDHVIRMLLTLNSQYYREVQLPEASFGLIGSAMALVGLFIPRLALALTRKQTPGRNLWLVGGMTFVGMMGMTLFIPFFGVLPAMMLSAAMMMINFFVSHYLNQITPSHQRATVLSFKGLTYNLAYGSIGLLYSLLLATLRSNAVSRQPDLAAEALESLVYQQSVGYFPWYFLAMFILLVIFSRFQLRGSNASA